MRRQSSIVASLLVLSCASSGVWAKGNRKFNILDDILAFPQYRLQFPDGFVLDSQARALLDEVAFSSPVADKRENYDQTPLQDESHDPIRDGSPEGEANLSYEELILEGQRYLCQIPVVEDSDNNRTKEEVNEDEERKELARATDRGLELLSEMEGRCLYYISGWWSYSFCYMNQVKQFHALSSGGGIPNYPPMEDHTTHSFVLGKFPREDGQEEDDNDAKPGKIPTDLAELQTMGGSRYLVQHLEGGDRCDLTGKNRRIEVQFHCNPHSTDRIAWIKELHTCSYLMLIYTPRLCNDVAFLPPPQDDVHTIECREILTPEEVFDWQAMHEYHLSQKLVESAETSEYPIIGGIEVGAKRLVGTEGRVIEKGRIATIGEKKVEVIAAREKGEVKLFTTDLKKYDLEGENFETLKQKLDKWAEGEDWTLQWVTPAGGQPLLQAVKDQEEDEAEKAEKTEQGVSEEKEVPRKIEKNPDRQEWKAPEEDVKEEEAEKGQAETGSEETFKDEL
ncbi:glucosidase II beta subunit-like protein-domain-containing protein [Aspergillus karnatakaensis]|uniref:PRKCSH domain-containing protein n=1 Tax=Aspergillus karnatakaensis TaxID=1810916 RepID=UPI003CCD21ED